ncbi:MAG: fused MFS/spermidine synthase [Planctomycetaceae bacterium]|nr:fused MFS/spermidine synthase [Planctomycetaceae bacterium]
MRLATALVGTTLLVGAAVVLVVQTRAGEVVYRTESDFNTIIVTEDQQGIRTLRFEEYGARQSVVKLGDPDYLALPYAKAVHVGLALPENPKRVLVVGLGGGTIPQFLRRHFPDLMIDAVEIDPVVVQVAKTYFGLDPDDKLRVFVADGREFIERSEPIYDAIYLDAYSADSVPYALTTREFLQATRKALTPDGVVVGNVWSSRSNKLYDSMIRTYQDVFEQVAVNDVRGVGNKIVIAAAGGKPLTKDEVAARSASLASRGKFPYDLREIVEEGYHLLDKPDEKGEVLRDQPSP